MFAALGKNGQILSIAPSSGILFVRMGNSSPGDVPFTFCNDIWFHLNKVMCSTTQTKNQQGRKEGVQISSNEENGNLKILLPEGLESGQRLFMDVLDLTGKKLRDGILLGGAREIPTAFLAPGIYQLRIRGKEFQQTLRFRKF
jgi:hypothetical protein